MEWIISIIGFALVVALLVVARALRRLRVEVAGLRALFLGVRTCRFTSADGATSSPFPVDSTPVPATRPEGIPDGDDDETRMLSRPSPAVFRAAGAA